MGKKIIGIETAFKSTGITACPGMNGTQSLQFMGSSVVAALLITNISTNSLSSLIFLR